MWVSLLPLIFTEGVDCWWRGCIVGGGVDCWWRERIVDGGGGLLVKGVGC